MMSGFLVGVGIALLIIVLLVVGAVKKHSEK